MRPERKPCAWIHGRHLRFGLLFLFLSLLFQIETLLIRPRADSAAWLFMGAQQARGLMPGRDLWDNKLPLIYLIGRAAMASGSPQVFLWIFEAGLTAVGALAVFAILTTRCSSATNPKDDEGASERAAPLAAGVLLCVLSGAPAYHAGGFMTEIYAMPLTVVGVWLSMCALQQSRGLAFTAPAGVVWMVAISFRLPVIIVALTVVGYLAFSRRHRAFAFLFGHMAGAGIGGMLVMAHPICVGYSWDCIETAILWPLGLTGEHVPGPRSLSIAGRMADFGQDIAKLSWIHFVALFGLFRLFRQGQRQIGVPVSAWYVSALATAAAGWAGYAHYQYLTFAPLALACGLMFKGMHGRRARRASSCLVVLTIAIVVTQNVRRLTASRSMPHDGDRSSIVRYVHENTKSDDTVLVWAWGRSADLLYRIDRPPGNRHFLAHSYFNMDLSLFSEMVEEFLNNPPEWIVEDLSRDKPALTRRLPEEWSKSYPALARLQDFAARNYVEVDRFGRFTVLRHRPSPTVHSSAYVGPRPYEVHAVNQPLALSSI